MEPSSGITLNNISEKLQVALESFYNSDAKGGKELIECMEKIVDSFLENMSSDVKNVEDKKKVKELYKKYHQPKDRLPSKRDKVSKKAYNVFQVCMDVNTDRVKEIKQKSLENPSQLKEIMADVAKAEAFEETIMSFAACLPRLPWKGRLDVHGMYYGNEDFRPELETLHKLEKLDTRFKNSIKRKLKGIKQGDTQTKKSVIKKAKQMCNEGREEFVKNATETTVKDWSSCRDDYDVIPPEFDDKERLNNQLEATQGMVLDTFIKTLK